MADKYKWTDEDEKAYQKYLKEADDEYKSTYGNIRHVADLPDSRTLARQYDIEDAHTILGDTFGRGGGAKYGRKLGNEGFLNTLELLGAGAAPSATGNTVTSKLPDIKKQMFQESGEPAETMELEKAAGAEGITPKAGPKAGPKTDKLNAEEFLKIRNEMRRASEDMSEKEEIGFKLDPIDKKTLEESLKDIEKEDGHRVYGYMPISEAERGMAAKRSGFDLRGAAKAAARLAHRENVKQTFEMPKPKVEKTTPAGTTIGIADTKKDLSTQYGLKSKANQIRYEKEMDTLGNFRNLMKFLNAAAPDLANEIKIASGISDWKLSTEGSPLSENAKTVLNESRTANDAIRAQRERRNPEFQKDFEKTKDRITNQIKSMTDKEIENTAKDVFGSGINVKKLPKKVLAGALGTMLANFLYSEENYKYFDDDKEQHAFADESDFGARYNAERFAGPDRNKMIKAGDLLINDWLDKFNKDNIDAEDLEKLEELQKLMNGYNASKGNNIRQSDATISDILSNPAYMRLFNKYTDPILRDIKKK